MAALMTEEEMMAALLDLDIVSEPDEAVPEPGGGTGEIKTSDEEDDVDSNFLEVDEDGDAISMENDFFNQPRTADSKFVSPRVRPVMVSALLSMNFENVSRTQYRTLPKILEHFDPDKNAADQKPGSHCVVQGPAGTGKTMAFILGSVVQIDPCIKKPQVLVIANTTDLAEQNQAQADLFCWKSSEGDGTDVLFEYADCNCANGIRNEAHTCSRKKQSRFGDQREDEIQTDKLVGGMVPTWQEKVRKNGGLNPEFNAQYVSMSMGVLKGILEQPKTGPERGKITKLAREFFEHVRVVVIDEADIIWQDKDIGGIKGLEEKVLTPICKARNFGKKTRSKQDKEQLSKTQFIFVSATFRPQDRGPMIEACNKLKKNGHGTDLKEVYLDNKDLLLKKVKQYSLRCPNYDAQYEALYQVIESIKEVSKAVLIIPAGESRKAGKQIGKTEEMEKICDYLKRKGLDMIDTFGRWRRATPDEVQNKSIKTPKRKDGIVRVQVPDAERVKKMRDFKNESIKYMIATTMDRGINIVACTHVIMFGMPTKAYESALENEYLQRVGRCGRKGRPGCSVILWHRPEEQNKMRDIERELDMAAENMCIEEATPFLDVASVENAKNKWIKEFEVKRKK